MTGGNRDYGSEKIISRTAATCKDSVAETTPSHSFVTESSSGTTIDRFPKNYISKLKREWLSSCLDVLRRLNPGFDDFDPAKQEKLILDRFLLSDMKFSCGGGVLPEDHRNLNLPSPLILQVDLMDELSDGRLRLGMTDGAHFIYGEEIQHHKDLNVSLASGFKVLIHGASISNRLIMLVPECLQVLGGTAEEDLDAVKARAPKSYDEIVSSNTDKLTEADEDMCYTYLTSLLEEWEKKKLVNDTATIRCKIQGTMTGLSEFEFWGTKQYELVVYFNDGSRTSKVRIHPDEVERQIGLTPTEMDEFLSSISDDDGDTLMDIQARLSSLQCTLVVEMSRNSDVPVAVVVDSRFDMSWVMKKWHGLHDDDVMPGKDISCTGCYWCGKTT